MTKVKENLVGKVFGRLTVLQQAEDYIYPDGQHRLSQWLCECNCKNHSRIVVRGSHLKNGNTQSCGCLCKENALKANKKVNKYDLSGEFGVVWATNTEEEVYFDLCDAQKILEHPWHISKNGYPVTSINGKPVKLHVFLGYKYYDHINRNKLDNRTINLRKCTIQENNRNHAKANNNTSGFIGVGWNKQDMVWVADIWINYKHISLGRFKQKEDAIRARLQAEFECYGEFAPQRHLFEQYGIQSVQEGEHNNG